MACAYEQRIKCLLHDVQKYHTLPPMKINTSITIDPRVAKLAKKYAALDGRSFANYVERAVAKQVEQDQLSESPKGKPAKKK